MKKFTYFPIIKTRDSELRCFKKLTENQLDKILPIYELTKSRKTKLSPDGDISKRMNEIKEIQKEKPFILDITTDTRYSNSQTRALLNSYHGFYEWHNFLFDTHKDLNIIPMIHLYLTNDFTEIKAFVSNCCSRTNIRHLAVRLPYNIDKDFLVACFGAISTSLSDTCKIYVILDVGYFRNEISLIQDITSSTCSAIVPFNSIIEEIILTSTTFPRSPAQTGKNDISGHFNIYEKELYQNLLTEFPELKYGDYASINTEQIEIKAAAFVPRIDIVSEDGDTFSYTRYRRLDGGYIRCAKELLTHNHYRKLKTWANEQIELAAHGFPEGISPSFWISVRMNYYIANRLNVIENLNNLF